MVHCGGQERLATGRRMPPARARLGAALLTLGVLAGLPAPASAQPAVGFQGGVAVDPEQVFGGVFWQTGDLGRGIRLRPGIDGATGQGLRIATINMDFVYGYPLGSNGWTLYAGGGPTVVVTRIPDVDLRDTGVGFHSLVGFGHDSGFFTEIRLGSGRAQQLKVGVGWAIALN
ncbi:MAG: hypothetical protein R2745_14375 [Vicinamibacterales bacterium]